MAKVEASVQELVLKIQQGELALPEMQRRYVWRSTRVRDLFDSLYRGYPSGAILLWETHEPVPIQGFAVPQEEPAFQKQLLLLDGQQRLTSLSALIRGVPVTVRGRKKPIDLLFNLDHPDKLTVVTEVNEESDAQDAGAEDGSEEDEARHDDEVDSSDDELQRRFDAMTFVVATKKLQRLPNWIRVTAVFKTDEDAPFLSRAGVERIDDPRYTMYSQRLARLRAIRDYVYRMDVLEPSMSYEEVTEIFVRVNSLGAKLRSSDLALAQITAKWRDSLVLFQAFQEECTKDGFELDLGIHLKTMVAFATGQSRFLTVGSLSLEQLQKAWAESCRGMTFAINFLKQNGGIDSPALLSSPFILVTIAYFGHLKGYEMGADLSDRLRIWMLLANAKGRYSRGSTETLLDQDLSALRETGDPSALVDLLRTQVGRLDTITGDLAGRNQRSALFKTMFLAFRAAGAHDWTSNLGIAVDNAGAQDKLQFHHIFPKALLRRAGRTPREADDIANLAFISGKTNRKISDKPPSDYLKDLLETHGPALFSAQCMPTDQELLDVESYDRFLISRRELITERLNEFLESAELGQPRPEVDPRLRELDARIEAVELEMRTVVERGLQDDAALLPEAIRQKVADRVATALRANPGHGGRHDTLAAKLEFCDFRDLQEILTARTLWSTFEPQFGTKDNLNVRFGQLAALRNAIRHSRTVDDVTRKDGEVALLWFRQSLASGAPTDANDRPGDTADAPMTRIAETFREAGLAAPPIPSRFESSLQALGPWWFATNDVSPPAMYLFETDFLLTLLTDQLEDFVAVSHAGHGANSYALSYFLVDGPLVLFLQTAWGGVYKDAEAAASAWRLLVSHVERLIQAARSSTGVNAGGAEERLVVVNSDFRGGGSWALCRTPMDEDAARALLERHLYEETATGPGDRQQALIDATAWAESAWL
jgi:hypothetical protein